MHVGGMQTDDVIPVSACHLPVSTQKAYLRTVENELG